MGAIAEHQSALGRWTERAVALALNGHDARAVGNYMLEKADDQGRRLTVMQLVNLVHLAHGFHLGLTGRPLIRHPVHAWPLGPVVSRVYEQYPPGAEDVFIFMRDGFGNLYRADFSDAERETMDMVFEGYSDLSAGKLFAITCDPDAPWAQVEDKWEFPVIPNKSIRDYYRGRFAATKRRLYG